MYFITLIRTVSKFALIAILFVLISTSSLVAADSDDIVSEIIEETDTTYIEENSSDTTNNPVEEISEDSSDNQDGSDEIISKLEDEQTNKELIKSDDIDSYIEDVDLLKNVFYDDEEDSNTSDELITHSGTSSDATTLYETDESDYIQEFDHYHTGSDTGAIESYLEEGELLTGESAIQTGDNTDLFSGSDDTIETTILLTGDDVDAPDTYYETGDMIGTGFVTSTGSLQGSGTESALEGTGSSQDEIESSLESSTDTSDTPVTYIEDEDDKYTTGNQSGTGDHDGVLSGDNLSGSLLSGNDLSETLLSGSNLSGEYLSGENKSGTTISEIQESVDAQDALENESKNSLSHTGDEEIITAIEINDLDDETLFTGETLTEELTGSDLFADAWIYNLYLSGDNQDIQQFATGLQEGLEIKYPTTNLHIDSYGRFSVADLQGFDVINHSSSMTYCSYASFLNLDNLLRISHQEKEYTILRGDAIAIWNKTIGEGNEIFQAPRTDNEELINELYDRYESDHDTIFDIVVKNNTRSGEVMGYHRFTIVLGDDDQFYALDAIRMHRQTPLLLTKYIENHIRSSEDISIVMSYDIHDKTIQELEQSELPVVHTPLDFLPFVQNGEIIYSEEKQTITFFTGLIYSSEDSRLQVFIPNGLVISALSGETLKLSQFNLDPETKSGFMASFQFGIPDQHIIFSQPVSITQVLEGADDNLIDIRVQHAGEDRPGKIGLTTNSKASCNLDGSVGPADQLEGAVSLQDGIIKFYTCGASLFEFIEAELPQTYTLTINHNMVSGSLSDFPVYVNLSELWTGMTLEGAESIRIYDDAYNELPREIVSKDELWFLAPSLSDQEDSNFTIDMDAIRSDYAADDEYGAYNVRRNDYVGRRHGSNFTDSVNGQTVSNNDGVVIESGTQIGKGFSHTNNAFGIPNPEDFVLTTFVTMSAWISTSSFNNGNIINVAGNNGYRFRVVSGNRIELLIRGGANNFSSSDNSVPSNTWTKIDITSDQNGTNIYINGQLDTSNNKSFAPGYTSAWMSIGSFNSSSEKYRGLIDEMHISHTSRSAAWIETEYNNQSNPASFYTLDKQEEAFDPMSIVLEVTTDAPNQTLRVNKYFNVANYTIDRGDGTTSTANGNNIDHTYSTPGTYYVTLKNPGERWKFTSSNVPLVPQDGTIADSVKIAYMPSLADGFGNSASSPGNYFFYNFNNNGALESLPSGSFDTSNITSVGIGFFSNFNQNGSLTSLPEGSFDTNNITTVSSNFFSSFNTNGALESLPSGSFDTSNITSVGNNFFANFNNNGALTKLPDDSFNTSNITSVGIGFFSNFNNGGALTKSPRGVKIKNVTNSNIIFYYNDNGNQSETVSAGDYFEGYNIATDPLDIIIEVNVASANQTLRINKYFNVTDYTIHRGDGSTSIANGNNIDHTYATPGTYYVTLQNPEERWKFKTGNNPLVPKSGTTANSVKIVYMPSLADGFGESASSPGNYFFRSFNYNGALESLPSGSFDTSNITSVGTNFFAYFNRDGALTSLPAGSFDISGISSVGTYFFAYFNYGGALTSLSEGSFDTSGISSVGSSFFYYFNYGGALTSLPEGSFDTSGITEVGNYFFGSFNYNGALTSLPEGSFDTSGITGSVGNNFFHHFNRNGALTALPAGSFDTSGIIEVGSYFFSYFNRDGALTALPVGSFDTSGISSVGSSFFYYFNYGGALTSLPEGSFDISNITTVGSNFFTNFNLNGALTKSPRGVKIKNVTNSNVTFHYSDNGNNSESVSPGNYFDSYTMDMSGSLDIILEVGVTSANQTLRVNKYFNVANYTIDRGDGTTSTANGNNIDHTYSTPGTYYVTLKNSGGRWLFSSSSVPLVPQAGTTADSVKIAYMPSLADGFGNSASSPGNYFFSSFNNNGALESLPSGSFDTSNITTVGSSFFYGFNQNGSLTSLPEGSFDTSNITTVGSNFFAYFNHSGALESLPEGSFDISGISGSVGDWFFYAFNYGGAINSLPEESFDISGISGSVGNSFFYGFNYNGALESLPSGSFDTSNITSVGIFFFYFFNRDGALESLPEGSFDTSNITSVGDGFFSYFNYSGALKSLPEGSFDTSNITTVGSSFFNQFNNGGALESLPEGSFDTSGISGSVGTYFFSYFNNNGALESLPEDSFDTSNITSVGSYFFLNFNNGGALTKAPRGVKIKNVTNGNVIFHYNDNGNKSESVSAGNYFDSYTMSGFMGFPPTIAGPASIDLGSISAQSNNQLLSGTSDYFIIDFVSSPYTGYYTTLEISDLVSTGSIIASGDIQVKANSLSVLSGDNNPAVSIDAGLLSFTNFGSGPLHFITKEAGDGAGIAGSYGSKLDIKIDLPAYQSVGKYTGTITYTLYEED